MGTKRPHASTHPSRQTQVPVEPSTKKRKTNPHPNRTLHSSTAAVNSLKSRIRSLTRLLEHDDDGDDTASRTDSYGKKQKSKSMPADIRIARERELQALKSQLEDAERERRKKEMIGRFHMVRFFDRRKAERVVKKLKRELKGLETAENGDGALARTTGTEKALRDAEVDLNYTQYYPLDVAYSSLWPSRERGKKKKGKQQDEDDDEQEVSVNDGAEAVAGDDKPRGDREMWDLVAKCMAEGKLDALRNGKVYKPRPTNAAGLGNGAVGGVGAKQDKDTKIRKQAKGKGADKASNTTKAKSTAKEDDEDESDGGFFE